MVNFLFVLAVNDPVSSVATFDSPFASWGSDVSSVFKDFAILLSSVLCLHHTGAGLGPVWSVLWFSSQCLWYAVLGQTHPCAVQG